MRIKRASLVLIVILIAGAALRLWGVGFGLPYLLHQDEPIVVNHALAYGTGDLNPHFFAIPPLTSYLLFFVYSLFFLSGQLAGLFHGSRDFALSFFKDPTVFYILGRIFIGVVPGMLAILFTYRLYSRLFMSVRGSLFAAAFMAFAFILVNDSRFIYTDMLLLLCIILSLTALARAKKAPTLKNYCLAGISIGLACAIKYNAALLIIPLLLMHLMNSHRRLLIDGRILAGLAAVVISFFMGNPFALLDFNSFVSALRTQSGAESYLGWLHHIRYSLLESIGLPLLILSVLGILRICTKHVSLAMLLFSFPVAFYLHLVFFSQQFYRYAIPLMPFLAIGAAYGFDLLLSKLRTRYIRSIFLVCCVILFVPLIIKSIKQDLLYNSPDTRVLAARWISANVEAREYIAVDHSFFRPVILQNVSQLEDKFAVTTQRNEASIKREKLNLMLEAQKGKDGFFVFFLSTYPSLRDQFLSALPAIPFDREELRNRGVNYVVINYTDPAREANMFYNDLKKSATLVAKFNPYISGEDPKVNFDTYATTCMPFASREIYRRAFSGPYLEVYKLTQ